MQSVHVCWKKREGGGSVYSRHVFGMCGGGAVLGRPCAVS